MDQVHLTRRQTLTALAAGAAGLAVASTASPAFAAPGSALRDLDRRLTGPLLLPGTRGYEKRYAPNNQRYRNLRPIAIAVVADAQDVSTCVRWARETGTDFAVRNGGHSYAGLSATQGLLIVTERLNGLSLNPKSGRARVGAGVENAQLRSAIAQGDKSRWTMPTGTCPGVGVSGYLLGGGISPNSPWGGLGIDGLLSTTVVTATGEIVTASRSENADLFWAMRGGSGGNFGINIDFRSQLLPIPVPRPTTFQVYSEGYDQTVAMLQAWHRIQDDDPRIWGTTSFAYRGEGGRPDGYAVGQVLAGRDEARDVLAPLIAAAGKVTMKERSWWDAFAWFEESYTKPDCDWELSRYHYDPVPDDAIAQQVEIASRAPHGRGNGGLVLWMNWVGGAVADVGRTDTAYVHRGATSLWRADAWWPAPGNGPARVDRIPTAQREWGDEARAAITPYTADEVYQNFADPTVKDYMAEYYGENAARLVKVKSKVDPDNVFTNSQGIR